VATSGKPFPCKKQHNTEASWPGNLLRFEAHVGNLQATDQNMLLENVCFSSGVNA
jgi:hypothetical protein